MLEAKRKKLLVATAFIMLALSALLAWQVNENINAKAPPSRQAITIAVSNTYIGSTLLYLAQAKGYFAQQGLDVTFLNHTSGRDAVNAVFEQHADLATSSNIPIMFSAMQGLPVSIVATIFSANREHGIVARSDRGIRRISDLKGKTIGVTTHSDSHFVLSTMLAPHQATLDDVQIESLSPDKMVDALQTGKVDAISTWEPGMTRALKALKGNGIEFRTEGGFLFDFNLVGRSDWNKANPDRLQKVLKALLMAQRFIEQAPASARKIILSNMHIDSENFNLEDARFRYVVQLDQNLLIVLEDQTRWAIQAKLTDKKTMPDYLSAIYMNALTAVKPEAVSIVR